MGLLLVVIMLRGCADNFILFPSTQPENANGAKREMIPFGKGGLEVLTARSPGAVRREPEAFVLCFCGNAGRAEWTASWDAKLWKDKAVEAWTVNYPGYGASTGPARLAMFPGAAIAVYDQMKARAGDRPVFVKGESLGTTLALHVAANRKVAGVILRSPVPLRRLIMGRFGWWNLWLAAVPVAMSVPMELDTPNTAPKVKSPGVFVLTDADEVVPVEYQRMVVDAYGGRKRLIENSANGHNGALKAKAIEELEAGLDWLWQEARREE
ncbi:MAG: alpha/beta fold hydrolase [Planctomycetota bacterium]|nr:alpha/beta fold hydrolase [Planctomycetota bacterium]